MTDAQLTKALMFCFNAGWLDAKNVENRYSKSGTESIRKRAEAVVAQVVRREKKEEDG